MKVYILLSEFDWEGYEIRGVFLNKTLAESEAAEYTKAIKKPFDHITYSVAEFDILETATQALEARKSQEEVSA